MTMKIPAVGDRLLYTLSEQDAEAINRRRADAARNLAAHRDAADGSQVHVGNPAEEGQVYPLDVVRVWSGQPDAALNGQVLLDGNDTLWVSSRNGGLPARGRWHWPARARF